MSAITEVQKRAAQFMAMWLQEHLPRRWPRGQAPVSLWDRRVREYQRRAWDALYQTHPEVYRVARAHGVADTWVQVEKILWHHK